MFFRHRTQAFILKKEDRGEADKILTVYAKDFGKVRIFGKAVRKIKSKLNGGIRRFSLSEIEFVQGKNYKRLIDSSAIEGFENVRKDFKKNEIAGQIAGVFDDLIKGEEKDEKIWNLLNETFNELNNYQSLIINYRLFYYYFLWNFLSILGYKPRLSEGKKLSSPIEINSFCAKILRVILEKDFNALLKLEIDKANFKTLENISENYLSHIKN